MGPDDFLSPDEAAKSPDKAADTEQKVEKEAKVEGEEVKTDLKKNISEDEANAELARRAKALEAEEEGEKRDKLQHENATDSAPAQAKLDHDAEPESDEYVPDQSRKKESSKGTFVSAEEAESVPGQS